MRKHNHPRQAARRRRRSSHVTALKSHYRRPLRYEPLEDRRLLAVVTVNTLADTIDFNDGLTSLREAIFATNLVGGPDSIDFAPSLTANGPATILLTQGELKITDSVTINGPGANLLTIDASGNDPTPDQNNGDGSRIFNLDDGTSLIIDFSISNVRITGGDTSTSGGAILSTEALHLTNTNVDHNASAYSVITGSETVTITGCSITENEVTRSSRGSATVHGGTLLIRNSVISGNLGGGISSGGYGDTYVSDSTISNNSYLGIISKVFGKITIARTTVSGNLGGGAYFYPNTNVTIQGCSFVNNRSSDVGGLAASGNIQILDSEFVANAAGNGGGVQFTDHYQITPRDQRIVNSIFRDNSARFYGGAVYINDQGSSNAAVVLCANVIEGNTANHSGGGVAIVGWYGNVRIENSAILHNSAAYDGGGIYVETRLSPSVFVAVENSAIYSNTSRYGGGVAVLATGGSIVIQQATISKNTAVTAGGGLWIDASNGGNFVVDHCTISQNESMGSGGGMVASVNNGSFQLHHTIIAENEANTGNSIDFAGGGTSFSMTYSLIGNSLGSMLTPAPIGSPDANGNLIGGTTAATAIDAKLGPLADNGGFTLPDGSHILTHALLPGSPAINAGDLNLRAGVDGVPEFDQRGTPSGRVVNGRIDIGAFEYQAASDLNLLVDTLVDESDGDYSRGDLSLREAIELANLWPSVDTIHFDPALTANGPATILLTQGELKVTDSLTINGPGAELLTIDASGNDPTPTFKDGKGSRVFNIDDANSTQQIDVTLTGMTLRGGDSARDGDAISSNEDLTLIGLILKSESAQGEGQVIFQAGGTLQLIDSEVIGSSTDGNAIATTNSAVLIQNSTITFTSRNAFTGTLFAQGGTVDISHSSFSGNSGSAAILVWNGPLHIDHSVISQNLSGIVTRYSDVSITDTTVSENGTSGQTSFYGGGADILGGTLLLERCEFAGNAAQASQGGGGILTRQTQVTIVDSHFTKNTAASGSAIKIQEGTAKILGSTLIENVVSGPTSSLPGALSSTSASLEIKDCTITNNTVAIVNSFGYGLAVGGASLNTITVENTTFSDNYSGAYFSVLGGLVSIKNSLFISSTYAGIRATLSGHARLQIDDSTISGNFAGYGGGLYVTMQSDAAASITGCEISNNTASTAGGGILARGGTLTIDRSSVHDNVTKKQGSGAIDSRANLRVTNSTISNNVGGGIRAFGPALNISGCVISGNTTTGSGGGIWASSSSTTIARCIITGNSAGADGGGLWLKAFQVSEVLESIIRGNVAGNSGGGVFADLFSTLEINRSVIQDNTAGRSGGGLQKVGYRSLKLGSTTFSGNSAAVNGGGISIDGAFVSSGNIEDLGATLNECTVSGNTAGALGGGIWARNAVDVNYSTITSNTASAAGGGIFSSYGPLTLDHTIVAANRANSGRDLTGLLGTTITANHSLIGSSAGSGLTPAPVGSPDANGNIIGGAVFLTYIAPLLGPLADNGGFTLPDGSHILTHALLAGSPAMNAGDPAAAMGGGGVPLHDQRGAPFIRVYGGRIDMGAVELQPATLLGDYNANGVVDAADYVLWRKSMNANPRLPADGNGDGQVTDADRLVWRANFGSTFTTTSTVVSSETVASEPAFIETVARLSPVRRPALLASRSTDFRPSVADHVLATVAASRTAPAQRAAFTETAIIHSTREDSAPARRDLLVAVDKAFAAFAVSSW